MKPSFSDAIVALGIDGGFSTKNGKITKWLVDKEQPSDEAIQEKLIQLQSEYEALDYSRKRKAEFDSKHPIADQLDYIFHHGVAKWKSDIVQPVKDKFPKP